jgi:membrane associated rhomboid family serine protease
VIPLRDNIPSQTFPIVNWMLIIANVLTFMFQVGLGQDAEAFIRTYGLTPRRFSQDPVGQAPALITSAFLHGSWLHLIGNMLYLHIFGDNIEDRFGHLRYLVLYLLCGISAGMAQMVIDPQSTVPMIGASGAIAGITGAYFLFFRHSRVITLVPIFFVLQTVEIPAVVFLFFWFIYQLMLGVGSLGVESQGGGVAFWAHIGGFIAGMVLGPALAPARRRVTPAWWQRQVS